MVPQVLGSASLPGEFFAAGLTTPEGDLSGKVQQRFHELRTATVSLLRVIAIGGGLSWVLLLLYSPGTLLDPVGTFFRNLLLALSALLLLAGVVKWERYYQPLMAAAALTYFALLAVHAVCLVIMGDSPPDAAAPGGLFGPARGVVRGILARAARGGNRPDSGVRRRGGEPRHPARFRPADRGPARPGSRGALCDRGIPRSENHPHH